MERRGSQGTMKAALLGLAICLSACTPSPSGQVTELIVTKPPSFNGLLLGKFTTPSATYIVNGECDPISYGLEWSTDAQTWNELPGGCPAGTFSNSVQVLGTAKTFYRARTKTGFTAYATATVRLLLPPTSPYTKFVNSGRADNEFRFGSQNEMSESTAGTMSNGVVTLKPTLVDTIYEN